jgi:cation diffusion facilitator CzcD-associated flavoprotein CzcO
MVANQSRHTMHFSDCAWEAGAPQLPRAWEVGRYLERYAERHLRGPRVEWRLGTRVVAAARAADGWSVTGRGVEGGKEVVDSFRYLVVASGIYGRPVVDEGFVAGGARGLVPVVHSSRYRDLESLLKADGRAGGPRKGKILVVGGQFSGVEIAGTIGADISSARWSPGTPPVEGDGLTVHHVAQQPMWVFPLHTTPQVRHL